eukprot:7566574-Alexandrium_andersonii.AAC.1
MFRGGANKKIEKFVQSYEAENSLENYSFTERYTVKKRELGGVEGFISLAEDKPGVGEFEAKQMEFEGSERLSELEAEGVESFINLARDRSEEDEVEDERMELEGT